MIHIKYQLKESTEHGVGLFSDQEIKAGDLIYTPNPLLDIDLTQEEFDTLNPSEQKEVAYYGYWNKNSNRWHVAFEAIRFLNHGDSMAANVTQDKNMIMTAKRDIEPGEELFQNYDEIYASDDAHFSRIGN